MRNDGSSSEEFFKAKMESIFGKKVFIEKFTDTKAVKGVNKTGFVKSSPADFVVTALGKMFWAEVKSCSDKVSFPISQLTASQVRAIVRQEAAGGQYWVFIHNMNTDKWYKVAGSELLALDKKSIKWTEMKELQWTTQM